MIFGALQPRFAGASVRALPHVLGPNAGELSRDLSGPRTPNDGVSQSAPGSTDFATHWPPERHTGSRGLWGWGDSGRSRIGAYCRRVGACLPAGMIISIALVHPALRILVPDEQSGCFRAVPAADEISEE